MRDALLTACRVALLLGTACMVTRAQPLFTPRGISFGAYAPLGSDVRGFLANPAGLPGMRDWDVEAVMALPRTGGGLLFDGLALGKRLFDNHALALQYSPGTELSFVLPSTIRIRGLDFTADRKVTYAERFAAAYALSLSPRLSLGLAARLQTETVSDPQLALEDTTIVSVPNEAGRTSWFVDLGMRWQAAEGVALSLLGRGIPLVTGGHLPEEFRVYERPRQAALEAGVQVAVHPGMRLGLVAGTAGTGMLGGEWHPVPSLALRASLYADREQKGPVHALAAGAGWRLGPLDLDASYLHFIDQTDRGGSIAAAELTGAAIRSINMSPFAADRLSVGLRMSLGKVREQALRIQGVEMQQAVYPASLARAAYRPLGRVRVKNVGREAVDARASFFVDHLMDGPTESAAVSLGPGEETDIPLLAVFNESVKDLASVSVREGSVAVTTAPSGDEEDRTQTRVVIRGKNDWDGDAESLRSFVRPQDPEVLRETRAILLRQRDSLASGGLELFSKAKALFNAFAGQLVYVNDPKQSADFVQYPDETLRLRGGDCDDMTVCFASLLGSVGIATAFVDVVPPGAPQEGHIYLLVDTGLDPRYAGNIAQNPKRYVVRPGKHGSESIWLPVETTVIMKGFAEAWRAGAEEHYENVEVRLGLARGWVKIVDVEAQF